MWLIRWLKEAQKFEEQITLLKAVTGNVKGKKVRITEDQINLLLACGMLGITTHEQLYDVFGIKNPFEDAKN